MILTPGLQIYFKSYKAVLSWARLSIVKKITNDGQINKALRADLNIHGKTLISTLINTEGNRYR
jgi:hypothetical protein